MYTQVWTGLKEGLVYFGKDLSTVALQSTGWTISDDGLEYTFTLRDDNVWYDGTPVTAQDYVTAVIYQLTPGRESKYGWDSPFASLVNAGDFRAGAAEADAVGVDAVDDTTIKFTLLRPRPDFVNALVTGSCYPLQTAAWEEFGDDWVKLENFQGNGPYMVDEWVMEESMTLSPNPNYNLERGNLEKIILKFAGKPLEAYQADEIDVAGIGAVADLVVCQNDPELNEQLSAIDTSGIEWLAPLKSEDGFLYDNPVVLKAIAKAVDIAAIINPIWLGIKRATAQMFYPVQPGFDAKYDIVHSVEDAQQMLADAGFPNGEGIPNLKLTFPSYQNQDYISTWTAIAAVVKDTLNINLELNNLETGIYSQVAYDSLNPAEEAGLCFYASGKPWRDPLFGFEFTGQLNEFEDSATYKEYAQQLKMTRDIRQGIEVVEGGEDADFEDVIAQLTMLKEEVLAIYADKGLPEEMVADVTKTFDGWLDAATKAAEAAAGGEDRETKWMEVNAALSDAKARLFLATNRREVKWQIDMWRLEAQKSTDEAEQVALSKQAFEVLVDDGYHIPLWIAQAVSLVKPYVTEYYRNAFWWGNAMYLKWVSIV